MTVESPWENMVQRHSIILWKKAVEKDKCFEEIATEAYEVFSLFQDYPEELRPNYLTANTKKDIQKFEWNYENFSKELKKGVNKEGKNIFEDLGYSISFFSCRKEENSCGFQMSTGNKNGKFFNTLIIHLPLSINLFEEKMAAEIGKLFEKLVQIYMPYWGCVSNRVLSRQYGKFLEGNLPTTVHWINYWSEDIIRTIGMEKIQKVLDKNTVLSFQNGIFSIRNTALDMEKEDDVSYHEELQKQLLR